MSLKKKPKSREAEPTEQLKAIKKKWTHKYPDPSKFHTSNSIHGDSGINTADFFRFMKKTSQSFLNTEFADLSCSTSYGRTRHSELNREKNRYHDIPCLDETRVKLRDGYGGNYIHASYVDGYKQEKAYILAQGPMDNTMVDFWRMIWQEKTLICVAVTLIYETGVCKCNVYWPLLENQVMRYGPFVVRNAKTKVEADRWNISFLELRHIGLREPIRNLYHIHYIDWKDRSVPTDLSAIFRILEIIHDRQNLLMLQYPKWEGHPLGPPIVVHCSAGLGRSSTLVAMDIILRRLLSTGLVDIRKTVFNLRTQRHGAIQTPEQYLLLYIAVLQCILKEGMVNRDTIKLDNFWDTSLISSVKRKTNGISASISRSIRSIIKK